MNNDKIEEMLSQLIKMVGNIQSEQQEMKQTQQDMKQTQQDMQSKLQELEIKGEERHKEILNRFKSLEIDQDFIWEKTARNERELAKIKNNLQL